MSRHLLSVVSIRETIAVRDHEVEIRQRQVHVGETDPLDVPEIDGLLFDRPPQRRKEREVSRVLGLLDEIQAERTKPK